MERFRNRIFLDEGYRRTTVHSFESCESACRSDERCEAFLFTRASAQRRLIERPGEWFKNGEHDSGVKRQRP